MSAKKATKKTAKDVTKRAGFTAEERSAMKERAQELKASAGDGDATVLAKIAEMAEPDRALAKRIHAIVRAAAPGLTPKLWYGMPAYAKDGKVLCFVQAASKFKTRYATLGFTDQAHLDDGTLWPTAFAVKKLTSTEEATIRALVQRAVR